MYEIVFSAQMMWYRVFYDSELLDLEIYCKWRHMVVIPVLDIDANLELTPKQMGIFKQVLTSFGSAR